MYVKARAFIATELIYSPPAGDRLNDFSWAGGNGRSWSYDRGTSKGDVTAKFTFDRKGYILGSECVVLASCMHTCDAGGELYALVQLLLRHVRVLVMMLWRVQKHQGKRQAL